MIGGKCLIVLTLLDMIFFVNYGGIENRKVLDSLELFATHVMPLFKG